MADIRPATEKDIPRILELYHELTIAITKVEQRSTASPDDYRKVFNKICADPRHELLVAEYQGEVVGTVALLIVPNLSHSATPWALVENVIVSQRHRRRGIGKQLMQYCIAKARDSGCHRIELCSDKRRKEAHKLYRSVGFQASAHGFRIYF